MSTFQTLQSARPFFVQPTMAASAILFLLGCRRHHPRQIVGGFRDIPRCLPLQPSRHLPSSVSVGTAILISSNCRCRLSKKELAKLVDQLFVNTEDYSTIFVTTPEPTVLPPSRMAKRLPSCIAIPFCSSTSRETLSPGMHISAPPSSFAVPVTSVVRK